MNAPVQTFKQIQQTSRVVDALAGGIAVTPSRDWSPVRVLLRDRKIYDAAADDDSPAHLDPAKADEAPGTLLLHVTRHGVFAGCFILLYAGTHTWSVHTLLGELCRENMRGRRDDWGLTWYSTTPTASGWFHNARRRIPRVCCLP